MTTPSSSDSGQGQESDTESYASAEAGSGQDTASLAAVLDVARDHGTGADAQSMFILVQVAADIDAGLGYESWLTSGPVVVDSDSGTGGEGSGFFPSSSDAGSAQDVAGPLGIWPFPPPWLFAVGGAYQLIWRPGTPDERLVKTFPALDQHVIRYAQMIREANDLQMPFDSDEGAGSESTRPTATIVQYALGALVTCGVPS